MGSTVFANSAIAVFGALRIKDDISSFIFLQNHVTVKRGES